MKKLPTLHIINGDASLPAFNSANLPGQVLVWREVLSEGPVIGSLPEPDFWQKREQFITESYKATPNGYKTKVLSEVEKLQTVSAFFEVILWFDSDLMCQINLLYLLQKLNKQGVSIISVCTPENDKHIGYLSASELQDLFEKREPKRESELKQANELWQLYAGPDPLNLQRYLNQHKLQSKNLLQAMQLHLSRFPGCKTGLSQPECIFLTLIQNGADTMQQAMQQFWLQHPDYGFGDTQLQSILHRLSPELVHINDTLEITEQGVKVLAGESSFQPKPQWLGGVHLSPKQVWCFDTASQSLVGL